ncbi:MAG: outer membrane lipoprotein carrier protein LolA [Thermodesulfobacteriota bacterium]|nr:outer membrane lipoprotein carrier protein LolA [Thermodesulfobacteriota bacterium]
MIKKLFYLFILNTLLFSGGIAHGGELSPLEIAKKLQKTYNQTTSIVADFKQTSSIPMSRRQRKGSGSLVIQKPGLMRWDYRLPEEQVLVSDGTTISMYFAENKQMIVMPAKDYLKSDITYAFFSGSGDILRDFEILPPEKTDLDPHFHQIKLIPKKNHPQVGSLTVSVDRESFLIKRLVIVDHFDSVTDLLFVNLKVNEHKPAEFFFFTPPPGTEIIKQ